MVRHQPTSLTTDTDIEQAFGILLAWFHVGILDADCGTVGNETVIQSLGNLAQSDRLRGNQLGNGVIMATTIKFLSYRLLLLTEVMSRRLQMQLQW